MSYNNVNGYTDAPCLDKTSHKAVCPRCGRKTFVNYLYPDGTPVADGQCGRCDRQDKCGYHLPPRKYLSERRSLSDVLPRKLRQLSEPCYIHNDDMAATLRCYERNNLALFLHSVFNAHMDADAIDALLRLYGLGTASQGKAIFWQTDRRGGIRTGKVMGYDRVTGKRSHGEGSMNWAHSLMKEKYPDFRLEQAYFGSHLLPNIKREAALNNKERERMGIEGEFKPRIWLFESEKAALISALYLKWGGADNVFLPMATGGCEGFNPTPEAMANPYHRLRALKGCKVTLFPDEGKYADWLQKAKRLKGYCADISVSTVMERNLHPVRIECEIGRGDGFDDIILRYMASGRIDQIINLL